jgi:hypothetical protein
MRVTCTDLIVADQSRPAKRRVHFIKTVREPNPEGEENPYPGLPLTNAAATLLYEFAMRSVH